MIDPIPEAMKATPSRPHTDYRHQIARDRWPKERQAHLF